jgi:hypothetical protein
LLEMGSTHQHLTCNVRRNAATNSAGPLRRQSVTAADSQQPGDRRTPGGSIIRHDKQGEG